MTLKLTPFNPADMLETKDDILEYLTEAYRDDDPMLFITALGNVAKSEGVAMISERSGLSRESLYKTFSGKVQPRWDTIHRILKVLEIRLEAVA